jgi:hypothetical protein
MNVRPLGLDVDEVPARRSALYLKAAAELAGVFVGE